uniref:EGF-like domain-containing protein n=1 Tax=Acrobeloides nanus TaxID=290746 RepID=A0A914EIK4_9BILA
MISDKQCVPAFEKAGIGKSCARGEACIGGAKCHPISQTCVCPAGFTKSGESCIRITVSETTAATTLLPTPPAYEKLETTTTDFVTGKASTVTSSMHSGRCLKDSDCFGGARCRVGYCLCPPNMLMRNGTCQSPFAPTKGQVGLLGNHCDSNDDCIILHSECVSGECQCSEGYRIFGSTQCIPKVPLPSPSRPKVVIVEVAPGEKCNVSRVCSHGSFCHKNVCICPKGTKLANGQCVPTPIVPPLASCENGETCSGNSQCVNGLCFCPPNHTLYKGYCYSPDQVKIWKKEEEEWQKRIEMLGNISTIVGNGPFPLPNLSTTATPDFQSIFTTNRPWPAKETLTPEKTSSNTLFPKENPRKITSITSTTTLSPLSTTEEIETVEEEVTESRPTELSNILTGIGKLLPVLITNSKFPDENIQRTMPIIPDTILKIAKPGMFCDDEMVFCSNGSLCVQNQCDCAQNLVFQNGFCYRSDFFAKSCASSNQCASGAQCINGVCECGVGMVASRFGFCIHVTKVLPGMTCSDGELCDGGSHCLDELCTCPIDRPNIIDGLCVPISSMTTNQNHKRKKRYYDSPSMAEDEQQRKMEDLPKYLLDKNIIEEPPIEGVAASPEDKEFVEKINSILTEMGNMNPLPSILGDSCQDSRQCQDGAECLNGICQCRGEYFQAGSFCILRTKISNNIVNPNQACQPGDFCDGGSKCNNEICTCPGRQIARGKTCSNILKMLEEECTNDQMCADGLFCRHNRCTNSSMIHIEKKQIRRAPGLSCRNSPTTCTGGSFCYNGFCVCPTGLVESNGQCVVPTLYAQPGQSCNRDPGTVEVIQCTGNSICANGFCICPGGEFIQNYMCVTADSIADPGDPCIVNTTTCTGNALCINGFCVCPSRQMVLNGQCASMTVIAVYPNQACGSQSVCIGNSVCQSGYCQCAPGSVYSQAINRCQYASSNQEINVCHTMGVQILASRAPTQGPYAWVAQLVCKTCALVQMGIQPRGLNVFLLIMVVGHHVRIMQIAMAEQLVFKIRVPARMAINIKTITACRYIRQRHRLD